MIKTYSAEEKAKDYLLDSLKSLSLEEVVEIYKTSCNKEIAKLADDMCAK